MSRILGESESAIQGRHTYYFFWGGERKNGWRDIFLALHTTSVDPSSGFSHSVALGQGMPRRTEEKGRQGKTRVNPVSKYPLLPLSRFQWPPVARAESTPPPRLVCLSETPGSSRLSLPESCKVEVRERERERETQRRSTQSKERERERERERDSAKKHAGQRERERERERERDSAKKHAGQKHSSTCKQTPSTT